MFKVTKLNEQRLDIELSGKLNSADMKIALDELASKAQDVSNGAMMYTIVDFHFPSLGAIAVEFSRLPSMFGLIKKFNKAAILTDKTWLKKASEFEGALMPGLDIKTFDLNQKTEAEAWLQGEQGTPHSTNMRNEG